MAYEQLRRMINESTEDTYTDNDLLGYLADYNQDYNAVASVILLEKASALQMTMYDYGTEGERFQLSQVIENIKDMARQYSQKKKADTTLWVKSPVEEDDSDGLQVG